MKQFDELSKYDFAFTCSTDGETWHTYIFDNADEMREFARKFATENESNGKVNMYAQRFIGLDTYDVLNNTKKLSDVGYVLPFRYVAIDSDSIDCIFDQLNKAEANIKYGPHGNPLTGYDNCQLCMCYGIVNSLRTLGLKLIRKPNGMWDANIPATAHFDDDFARRFW